MRIDLSSNEQSPTNHLLLILFFFFKTIPLLIAGGSIYLGYRLFILGVTGQASLSVDTGTISGQLINAAPGLFFAIGGLLALIIMVWKGGEVRMPKSKMSVRGKEATELSGHELSKDWREQGIEIYGEG